MADSPIVATVLNTCEYKRDNNTITLLLTNSMQEQAFQLKLQPPLLKHFRNQLQNDHIELKAVIQHDQTGPKRVYTDEDRLQMLEEEYPHLKDLRDKLGLIIG